MSKPAAATQASQPDSTGRDRRVFPRRSFVRPCKVQRTGDVRFEAGETTNISAGGALIKVAGRQPIRPGERLRVGVAWETKGVLESGSLLPARVVRVVPIDFHHQAVAIQYDRPLAEQAPLSMQVVERERAAVAA